MHGEDLNKDSSVPVEEEGVTSAIALWHQRNRWAEGAYQRYLDYCRYIFNSPIGFGKRIDLLVFVLLQYILPAALIPDFVMILMRHHLPILLKFDLPWLQFPLLNINILLASLLACLLSC